MNSTIRFHDAKLFGAALTVLELETTPAYESDSVDLTITSDDADGVAVILEDNGIFLFDLEEVDDVSLPGEDMDGDHASALASVYGDNEDCGMSMYDDRCDCGD